MAALLDEQATVQAMMDFEAALARAQARAGLIPPAAAQAIASLCRAELYDVPGLVAASGRCGSLAVPLVRKLTETVALFDPAAAGYVHLGCCQQDLLDTALVLQLRRALRLIDEDLLALCGHLLDLAERSAAMPMLARAQLQPTLVGSLRSKLTPVLLPLLRSAQALRREAGEALLLQLGGTAGAQAALGPQADAVAAQMAAELQLGLAEMPWLTQRDRLVRLAAELALLCAGLGKLARDLALLGQAEVGEIATPDLGAGGSILPHKRQPVAHAQALAAARRAPQRVAALLACMDQEHEGGVAGWQAEPAEWAGLLLSSHGALRALSTAVAGLQVQPARMLGNIDAQQDLVCAEGLTQLLARAWGPTRAQQAVEGLAQRARSQGLALRRLARTLLQEDAELGAAIAPAELEEVFDVQAAARQADARVGPALQQARARWQALIDSPPP